MKSKLAFLKLGVGLFAVLAAGVSVVRDNDYVFAVIWAAVAVWFIIDGIYRLAAKR